MDIFLRDFLLEKSGFFSEPENPGFWKKSLFSKIKPGPKIAKTGKSRKKNRDIGIAGKESATGGGGLLIFFFIARVGVFISRYE